MSLEKTENPELISVSFLSAAASHPGLRRANNEDRFILDANNGFFAVIDGMGGHAGGEIAAQAALETIRAAIGKIENSPEIRLRDAVILANNAICEKSEEDENLAGMGCVLTSLLIENETAIVAHVGDTRLYKIQNQEITKLTTDHSPVGELEENGDLSEIGLMRHPRRNEVSRCLGLSKLDFSGASFVDTFRVSFEPESAFLLCSDGLSDLLTSNKILEIISDRAQSPESVARGLIAEANGAGGKDNVTVVFVAGGKFFGVVEKWRETAAETLRKNSLKNRIKLVIFSRWAFFLYGILLGAGLLFWYFYQIIPADLAIPAP